MRKTLVGVLLLALAAGCDASGTAEPAELRIVPAIETRVTGLHFDAGDRIGVNVTRTSGRFAENTPMTYDGTTFSGAGLVWYADSEESCTLTARYPYDAAGMTDRFAVATDQREEAERSDLLVAVKRDVKPGAALVAMTFRHLMAQLNIVTVNNSTTTIGDVEIDGLVAEATIDYTAPAASAAAATPVTITCRPVTADERYRAILVPQRADLEVAVTTARGNRFTRRIADAELAGGKRYDLYVELNDTQIDIALSGDIADWTEGGPLAGSGTGTPPENPDDGTEANTLLHENERYRTLRVGTRTWMAENMRHIPAGSALGEGVWLPRGGEAEVAEAGLLYDFATAAAGETPAAGTPLRGICPEGWHLPDAEELTALKSEAPASFYSTAGYWVVNGVSDKYSTQPQCYLLGTDSGDAEGQRRYLQFTESGAAQLASIPGRNGVSLRCVKDN